MKFEIEISPEAIEHIEVQARFIAEEQLEPKSAEIWLSEVYDAIASLNFLPGRCSLAPENKFLDETIHMLRIHKHLILFTIDSAASIVRVYSFRAGRELPKQTKDI